LKRLSRVFKRVERGDLELLKKAIPHELEKILNMLENLIIHGTPQWIRKRDQPPTKSRNAFYSN